MTRRLVVAIVATVAAALLLAGLGSLLLAYGGSRRSTEANLRSEAADLATGLRELEDEVSAPQTGRPIVAERTRQRIINLVRRALQLDGIAVVVVRDGTTTDRLPDGVTLDDLDLAALTSGTVQSGVHGSLAWAAAHVDEVNQGDAIVVLTRTTNDGLRQAARWFGLSAIAVVLVAALVALALGRRLTAPVRDAERAARAMAAGDLSVRIADPPGPPDELTDLVHSVNTLAGELERSKQVEQQFLLSISHDLRTPLTNIRGYAEAIADGAATEPASAASVILDESRRLERLVRDLLDLAKLGSTGFQLHLVPVDLGAAVSQTAAGFAGALEARGRLLEIDAVGGALVLADPDRLAQVVANLVENAGSYATARVRVSVGADHDTAWIAVDDDGPGIAPDDLPHVFERLYVSKHQPRRRESSSGLGLAIVRELVEAMHGHASALAGPLGGARLVVRLPRTRPQ